MQSLRSRASRGALKTHGQPPRSVAEHLQYSGLVVCPAFNDNDASTTHKLAHRRLPRTRHHESLPTLTTERPLSPSPHSLHAAAIWRTHTKFPPSSEAPSQRTVSMIRGQNNSSRRARRPPNHDSVTICCRVQSYHRATLFDDRASRCRRFADSNRGSAVKGRKSGRCDSE